MRVETALGNAHRLGHIVHGHEVVAFARQQQVHRVEDGSFARFELLLLEREFQSEHGVMQPLKLFSAKCDY